MERDNDYYVSQYDSMKSEAFREYSAGNLDLSLSYACVAATCAWHRHLGFWHDDELEELLVKTGVAIREDSETGGGAKRGERRRVAYVATALRDFGGHSEVLGNWTGFLAGEYEQKVFVTNATNNPPSISGLQNDLRGEGISVRNLRFDDCYRKRTADLITCIEEYSPDIVCLFTHPNDVVAIAAVGALRDGKTVVLFNHADHVFWLGRSVLDCLIDFRERAAALSRTVRGIDNSTVVPFTTNVTGNTCPGSDLGVPEEATLSLSVGQLYKVFGDPDLDYFRTINELLESFPSHFHIFITNTPTSKTLRGHLPEDDDVRRRFIIAGPYSDLEPYYAAADFLIETFPLPGGVVRLEAMASGTPVIAFRNSRCPYISETDFLGEEYPLMASSGKQVVELSGRLIGDPSAGKVIGEQLRARYNNSFSPGVVRGLLLDIIDDPEAHRSVRIETSGDEESCGVNSEYFRLLERNKCELNQELIDQATLKRAGFSARQRLIFFSRAVREREFRSARRFAYYVFVSILGRRGVKAFRFLKDLLS